MCVQSVVIRGDWRPHRPRCEPPFKRVSVSGGGDGESSHSNNKNKLITTAQPQATAASEISHGLPPWPSGPTTFESHDTEMRIEILDLWPGVSPAGSALRAGALPASGQRAGGLQLYRMSAKAL